MQTHDGRESVFLADVVKQGQHTLRGRRVEAGHRLIGQQQAGLLHQGTRNANALLLPTRQGVCPC